MTQTNQSRAGKLLRLGSARRLTRSVRTGGPLEPLNPMLQWAMG